MEQKVLELDKKQRQAMRSYTFKIVAVENINERRQRLGSVEEIVHFDNMCMLQLRQLAQYLHLQLDDDVT